MTKAGRDQSSLFDQGKWYISDRNGATIRRCIYEAIAGSEVKLLMVRICFGDLYSPQVVDKELVRMLCRELGVSRSVLHKYYLSPQSHKNHDFSVFSCVKSRQEELEHRNLVQLLSRQSPKEGVHVISQETHFQVADW